MTIEQMISTHTLTWSVTVYLEYGYVFFDFNSHAHVERDAKLNINKKSVGIFQLTRSRGA